MYLLQKLPSLKSHWYMLLREYIAFGLIIATNLVVLLHFSDHLVSLKTNLHHFQNHLGFRFKGKPIFACSSW